MPGTDLNPIFAKNAGAIPEAFLRALAYKESGFRPDIVNPTSHATGLFQITQSALSSFNQRNNSSLQLGQLVNPELNARVASDHLRSVITGFRKHRSLQPDWTNRRWLELLVLAWNAGHGPIAQVAARMEAAGVPNERVNVDTVSKAAAELGAKARFVADSKRVAWAKSVASTFLGGKASRVLAESLVAVKDSTTSQVVLAMSGVLLFGAVLLKRARGKTV